VKRIFVPLFCSLPHKSLGCTIQRGDDSKSMLSAAVGNTDAVSIADARGMPRSRSRSVSECLAAMPA
jgi:hypothetical protein